jgi:hypothetical protein
MMPAFTQARDFVVARMIELIPLSVKNLTENFPKSVKAPLAWELKVKAVAVGQDKSLHSNCVMSREI